MTDSESGDTMIAALLRERDALVLRGLDDRVKQVDEQLKLRGYKPAGKSADPAEPADDEARQTPPKNPKTSGARQQTRTAD